MNNISSFFKTYKKELTTIFLFFIVTRLIFALMLNIGYYYLPKGYDVYDNVHKPLDIIFQFNDISNFLYIAQNGYNSSLYAFAPLYPVMIKLLSPIFFGSYEWAAFTI